MTINNLRLIFTAIGASLLTGLMATSCGDKDDNEPGGVTPPVPTDTVAPGPAIEPDFNKTIEPFDPTTRATDTYTPGGDNDVYWQANSFAYDITVTYDGDSATVTTNATRGVTTDVSGAHVAINITSDVKTRVTLTGKSTDGSLKIYSVAKVLMVLDNVDLTSTIGPAINSQSKKRLFIETPENSVATLTDAAVYSPDRYYPAGASVDTEDRKGAVFAEDNVIISGKGLLRINGHNRHGFATDGSVRILPGTTMAVTCDGKNGIHAKGSSKENLGIAMMGGYIYVNCSGDAGKCVKSDMDINVMSGVLALNCSSQATFDVEENGTSSGAGIKSDTNVNITGGDITVKLTGNGAKGISGDMNVNITDADITVTSTGTQYVHTLDTSSPAGIKADGDITLNSGIINVAMYGEDNSSDAIKAAGKITVNDGEVYCYAYGNGFTATDMLTIAGGSVYSLSRRDESITSKSAIDITGGLVLCYSPKALAASTASILTIDNATVIATGGRVMTNVDSRSPRAKVFGAVTLAAYEPFTVTAADGEPLFTMRYLPACEGAPLLVASPAFVASTTWNLTTGGTLGDGLSSWHGFYDGAGVSDPATITTFAF